MGKYIAPPSHHKDSLGGAMMRTYFNVPSKEICPVKLTQSLCLIIPSLRNANLWWFVTQVIFLFHLAAVGGKVPLVGARDIERGAI